LIDSKTPIFFIEYIRSSLSNQLDRFLSVDFILFNPSNKFLIVMFSISAFASGVILLYIVEPNADIAFSHKEIIFSLLDEFLVFRQF
jgi:hypothetical protein